MKKRKDNYIYSSRDPAIGGGIEKSKSLLVLDSSRHWRDFVRTVRKMQGFTIAELLVVIAIIGILSAVFLPLNSAMKKMNELGSAKDALAQSLRRAQSLSQAVDGDSTWGVHLESGKIIIFKGASYLGRDANYDELLSFSSRVGFSGLNDIIFSKVFGLPNNNGAININVGNESQSITINQKGIVNY